MVRIIGFGVNGLAGRTAGDMSSYHDCMLTLNDRWRFSGKSAVQMILDNDLHARSLSRSCTLVFQILKHGSQVSFSLGKLFWVLDDDFIAQYIGRSRDIFATPKAK